MGMLVPLLSPEQGDEKRLWVGVKPRASYGICHPRSKECPGEERKWQQMPTTECERSL